MLYDISPPVSLGAAVWPGDTPYSCRLACSIAEGSTVNVAVLTSTPHLGAHADAPLHTEARGEAIGHMPLERYLGPCRVVKVPAVALIESRHVADLELGHPPRLLFKTESVADRRVFPERFTALSAELANRLGAHGVVLVGLDTPSVDPLHSKTLDAHHALARHGVAILENLLLEGVPEGLYELIALPLRLMESDASPVRAVLRTIETP